MNFVDTGADLNTLKYLVKSLSPEVVEEILGKSETVMAYTEYTNKWGTLVRRRVPKKVGDDDDKKKAKSKVDEESGDEKSAKTDTKSKKTQEDKPKKKSAKSDEPAEKKTAKPKADMSAKKTAKAETPAKAEKKSAKSNKPAETKTPAVEPETGVERMGPYKKTPKVSHLVPIESLNPLPEHLKDYSIPPSLKHVYVSPDPKADCQILGMWGNGREHRMYTPEYMEERAKIKYDRIAKALGHRMSLATCIQKARTKDPDASDCLELMFKMGLRKGSKPKRGEKIEVFGASTLRGEHVVIKGGRLYLDFPGKKKVRQLHEVTDPHLRTMLMRRKRAAGNKGNLFNTSDTKLRKVMPPGLMLKDLRTIHACFLTQELLKKQPTPSNLKDFMKMRNDIGDVVSKSLGNKRETALKSYIDPEFFRERSPKLFEEWKNSDFAKEEDKRAQQIELSRNETYEEGDYDDDEEEDDDR